MFVEMVGTEVIVSDEVLVAELVGVMPDAEVDKVAGTL